MLSAFTHAVVYHRKHLCRQVSGQKEPLKKEGLEMVAVVTGDGSHLKASQFLEWVVLQTTQSDAWVNQDTQLHHWSQNTCVVAPFRPKRSTMVGDVIYCNHKFYEVRNVGCFPITVE